MLEPDDMPVLNPNDAKGTESEEIFGHIVDLDGATYINKTFTKCVIRYGGWEPPKLEKCAFLRSEFVFTGRALNTVTFLQSVAHSGSGGAEFIVQNLLGLNDWSVKDGLLR